MMNKWISTTHINLWFSIRRLFSRHDDLLVEFSECISIKEYLKMVISRYCLLIKHKFLSQSIYMNFWTKSISVKTGAYPKFSLHLTFLDLSWLLIRTELKLNDYSHLQFLSPTSPTWIIWKLAIAVIEYQHVIHSLIGQNVSNMAMKLRNFELLTFSSDSKDFSIRFVGWKKCSSFSDVGKFRGIKIFIK